MTEREGDVWTTACDAVCVPTNGKIDSSGALVMGAGMALRAKQLYPDLPRRAGRLVDLYGNTPFSFEFGDKKVVTFPTKRDWREKASLRLIENSALALVRMADREGWKAVALPRVGAGLGGLDWADVKAVLSPLLDDRFVVVSYPE